MKGGEVVRIAFEALFFVAIVLALWKIFTYESKEKPKQQEVKENEDA